MNFHHKNITGFTLIELMIVVAIFGILTRITATYFIESNNRSEYERFLYSIQHYIQDARSDTLVQESEHDGSSFTGTKSHGVFIDQTSTNSLEITMFVDENENNLYDSGTDTDIKSESITNNINIESFSGEESGETSTQSFNDLTVVFDKNTPNPVTITGTTEVFSHNLRSADLIFSFPDPNTSSAYKKITFDTISKVPLVQDYPIFTRATRTSDTTIEIFSNADISSSTFADSQFAVEQRSVDYTVSHTVSDGNIILTSGSNLPSSDSDPADYPIIIYYNFSSSSTVDEVPIKAQVLKITLEQS